MKKMYYLIRGKDAAFFKNLFIASLLMVSLNAYGQGGTLACNDLVQVSLDIDCQAQIIPDMILEGNYDPYSQFSVTISGIVGDVVTQPGSHTVTVTSNITGNSCWGNIDVEDKLPPIIDECPCAENNTDPDCRFLCSDLESIKDGSMAVPFPNVIENCGPYTTDTVDQVIDNGCAGQILVRTLKFTDQYGNSSLDCKSYYYFTPLKITDVTPPTSKVDLPCGNDVSMQAIFDYYRPLVGTAQANRNAYPTINGNPVTEQGPCNIIATKTDLTSLACGADCPKSFKMIRSWSVVDWCSDQTRDFVQIISTKDTEPPTIDAEDIEKTVNPWNCAANITFPQPKVLHDNCDDNVTYEVRGPIGVNLTYNPVNNQWVGLDIPKGNHIFYYVAKDCCGNTAQEEIEVDVIDKSAPVAISKEFVVVSLTKLNGNDGIAKIFPQSIDNGSHDGCTNVHLEIRREGNLCGHEGNLTYNNDGHYQDSPTDPDGGNFVKFCCEDLTDISEDGVPYGRVKVWLRVWDDGNMSGKFGDVVDGHSDNYNETWSWVRVEDKLPPSISCPNDVTLECYEDYTNLDRTGRATANFTCTTGMVEYTDNKDLNDCGFGVIIRTWKIKNGTNSCTQKITIREGNFFDPNTIVWPPDETTDCKNIDSYKVTWADAQCAKLGVSVTADTFQFVEDVCLKIINRYTVVDWCVYEPNDPYTGGIWTHTQIVKVLDQQRPTITCMDTMYVASDINDADNDQITCETRDVMVTSMASDEGDCSSKWLRWTIFVDLWGDGKSDYEYSSFLSANDNTFNDSNNNGIPDIYVSATSSNEEIKITIPGDIEGSMANHKISWKVTDGCGNHRSCTSILMVVDKKKPTPYCISLSSAVMDNGQVELWARDFDKGSFDNCTAQEDLYFTFNNASPIPGRLHQEHFFKGDGQVATAGEYDLGDAQKWVPDFKSSSKVFDCDDIPVTEVQMTVWDEKGEFDFCLVNLTLVDNQDACDDNGMRVSFSGNITDTNGDGMEGVEVSLINDQIPGYPKTTTSDENGAYVFDNIPSQLDYAIGFNKDTDYMNGVSTLDLVLIQRHILDLSTLDNPYKAIAGDVNNDGKIRTSDLVQLRKLILGVTDKFENNSSWRFIDKDQTFTDANNPWPFTEVMDVQSIDVDKTDINFFGQKIGDVNQSAKSNLSSQSTNNRSKQILKLWIEEQEVLSNNIITVDIKTPVASSIYGLQFSISAQDMSFIDLNSGIFDINEDNYSLDNEGNLLVSISAAELANTNEGESIFTMTFKAHKSGNLSEMLKLNDEVLEPEAYFTDLRAGGIQTAFVTTPVPNQAGFSVSQNEPNPFSNNTSVTFTIPEAGKVNMTIYNIDGKAVHQNNAFYPQGQHRFEIQKGQFPLNGVYYLKIENNNNSSTIKMIHLK